MSEKKVPTPSIGRVVHFVVPDGPCAGQHRPAFIVQIWSGGYLNLQVFFDGSNDGPIHGQPWQTSVEYSEEPKPRTWHWPEYVP